MYNCEFSNLTSKYAPAINFLSLIKAKNQYNLTIQNSKFINNQAENFGGAIASQQSNLDISNSTFSNNSAFTHGGALYLTCSVQNPKCIYQLCLIKIIIECKYKLTNNTFEKNEATSRGGGIYYDLYQPQDLESNYFDQNKAIYGNNIGSYPIKLQIINREQGFLQNLSSGQLVQDPIQITLIDQDLQTVVDQPESFLSISSDDLSIQIAGETSVMSKNGVFVFKNIKIIGKPQSTTTLNFKTNSINEDNLFRVSGRKDSSQYSLNLGEKACRVCPSNAKCEGGSVLLVSEGYWRNSTESISIMRCFKTGVCLGGYNSSCIEGYEGKLCTQCQKQTQSGKYFARSAQHSCSECLDIDKQGLILASIIIALGIYIFYIHYSLIRNSKRNNPQTLLIRILTNYFQVVMLVKDFQLNWPPQVLTMLEYFSIGGQGFSQVLSFECFLRNSTLNISMPLIYLQIILIGLLPLFLSSITLIVWILCYFSSKINMNSLELRRNIKTSFILFGFLCYPQISSNGFSLFSCLQFENGKSYLKQDMQIECWTKDHMNMMFMIGITFIIFYSFAFPAFIFIQLFLNKKNLNDKTIITQYGLFYSGLKDDFYYWEVLYVNIKKLFFIIFSSLLSTFNSYLRSMLAILLLFSEMQLSHHQNPYIDENMNHIDRFASLASISTLFGGILFLNDDIQDNSIALTAVFVIVLMINVAFLTNWAATFIKVIVRTNFKRITTLLIFLKKYNINSYEEDLKLRQKSHLQLKECNSNPDSQQIDKNYQTQSLKQQDNTNINSVSQIDSSTRHLISPSRGRSKFREQPDQTVNEEATFKFKLKNKKKTRKSSLSKIVKQQQPNHSGNQLDQSTFIQSKVKSVRFDNTTSQYLTDREQDNFNAQIFTTKNQLIKNENPFLPIKKNSGKSTHIEKLKIKFKM